eukprot:366301-Chlamydomonas_euryale.AAC.44
MKLGDGLDAGVTMGPMIGKAGVEKVHAHVIDAVSKGAKGLLACLSSSCFKSTSVVLSGCDRAWRTHDAATPQRSRRGESNVMTGGKKAVLPAPYDAGMFYEPTVLSGATFDMRCFSEETFGPLIPLFKFQSDQEVVMLANKTEYGLAAYFYTRDLARAWRVAEDLEYGASVLLDMLGSCGGCCIAQVAMEILCLVWFIQLPCMVGLNEVGITSEVAPFGGIKQSGLGREQSKYGLAEFQDIKYVCMGLGQK